jgi:hypothetical protein
LMLELTLAPSSRIESDINFSPASIQRVGLDSEAARRESSFQPDLSNSSVSGETPVPTS